MKKTFAVMLSIITLLACVSCASQEEKDYQKAVHLIQQEKYDDAMLSLTGPYLKNLKDSGILIDYISAKKYVAKGLSAPALKRLDSVSYTYSGTLAKEIIEFKKGLTLDVAELTQEQINSQMAIMKLDEQKLKADTDKFTEELKAKQENKQ